MYTSTFTRWIRRTYARPRPIVRIDWTTIPDRTQQAKNAIMTALTDKLAEITGENKMEINDIPLACGMLGGISHADNCDW